MTYFINYFTNDSNLNQLILLFNEDCKKLILLIDNLIINKNIYTKNIKKVKFYTLQLKGHFNSDIINSIYESCDFNNYKDLKKKYKLIKKIILNEIKILQEDFK